MQKIYTTVLILVISSLLFACGGSKKVGPAIIKGSTESVIRINSDFDVMDGITAIDSARGDVTKHITVEGSVDTKKAGIYTLTYTIVGSDGSINKLIRNVTVTALIMNGIEEALIVLGGGFDAKHNVFAIDPEIGRINFKRTDDEEVDNYIMIEEGTDVIDTQKTGTYDVVYHVIRKGLDKETFTRVVKVVDHAVIRGIADTKIEIKTPFNPLQNVTAVEPIKNEEGNYTVSDITEKIQVLGEVDTEKTGTYQLTYKILGSDGVEHEFKRNIEVYISVRILYASNAEVTKGSTFNPNEGVEAKDSLLGDISDRINIEGIVDTEKVGNYRLIYTVTGSEGIMAKVERTITVIEPVVEKQVIRIVVGDTRENDPFLNDYTGLNQLERQQLQIAVEEKYNVEVKYINYPAGANWGPNRINDIIKNSVSGTRYGDIYYNITTDYLRNLAQGGAIVPIDKYLNTENGKKIHHSMLDAGLYNERNYGFNYGMVNLESGLFYNADMVLELGIDNPTRLYLDGKWNWTKFKDWAVGAQAALKAKGDEFYALGGHYHYYVQHLLPLNGGQFINHNTKKIAFGNNKALEVYGFVDSLTKLNLFEPVRHYDAGSPAWQSGKVLVHPGQAWFVKHDIRWGKLEFEIGFVPYPINDNYTGEYKSPIFTLATNALASGMTQEKEQLAFNVWVELQRWRTEEEMKEEFRLSLIAKFEKEIYTEAFMSLYDKGYIDDLDALGISGFSADGYMTNINRGIANGDYRTRLESIIPIYQTALNNYYEGS